MSPVVASAIEIPELTEAAAARGLRIIPFRPGVTAQAALFGGDGEGIRCVRAAWAGPLLLVLPQGACVARALDAGADDAVAHPASAGEVAARLAARLRRRPAPLVLGALEIDLVDRRVTRAGRVIPLLPREYALLLHLARQAGRAASRADLLAGVWGLDFDPGTNVVEVHVSRLRAKLDRGFPAAMLVTESGIGYRLDAA